MAEDHRTTFTNEFESGSLQDGIYTYSPYYETDESNSLDIYYKYVRTAVLLTVVIANIVSLAILGRPKIISQHHAVVFVVGLIVSMVILYTSEFGITVHGYSASAENSHGNRIFCNIFVFLAYASHRCYVVCLYFALINRLLQTLANRNNFPSSTFLLFSRKLCRHTAARISVCVACLVGSALSSYYLTLSSDLEETNCWEDFFGGQFELLGVAFDFSLQVLLLLACSAYFVLCLVKEKRLTPCTNAVSRGIRLDDTRGLQEDGKSMKLFLILAALNFPFNTYSILGPMIKFTVAQPSLYYDLVIDFLNLLYAFCAPLLALLFWPGVKSTVKISNTILRPIR